MKTRLANGLTEGQAEQLQVARAKRWTNVSAEVRAAQGRRMHVGIARRLLSEVWPEGLAEFEARVQAHAETITTSHSGK